MTPDQAAARARTLFLDGDAFGCAETVFVVLKEAYGLPEPFDASAAMALNGGVAYSGGVCGALTGACLAVGLRADREICNRRVAKAKVTGVMAALMDDFAAEYGAVDCRTLIGRDISTPRGHRAFIDSGVWRETCMSQVETVVRALASLTCPADPADPAATSPAVETSPVDTSPVEPAGTPASEATE